MPEKSKIELPKAYDFKSVDKKWYQFWEEKELFKSNPESKKPAYSISIPPPNVTGSLHMGHALGGTLQDVLIRWKRMSGFETLWVPGTDHAGISTQTVVEKNLIKTTGKRRKDFSREEFLKHVWDWKEKNEGRIINQLKQLGCSCDWSRLRFTMDKDCNLAVRTIFKKLFDQGVIYRGDYLVNWDPLTQTALADDEVEYEERRSHLWYIKYPLKDGSGYIIIATTRPETMLGDTAVAVSPRDPRYTDLIGKTILLPLADREIPIVSDERIDPEFGTGAIKVTPAHDFVDYEIGVRHRLPMINMMTPDGKINEVGGKFAGMSMEEGREAVVKELELLGLLERVELHVNRVGVSYRSKATIEPYLSKQWFVKMSEFAKDLRTAVQEEKVLLIPRNWENTYFHWIDNLRDWCISRQLWWGHRIPIWYHTEDADKIICYEGEGEPPEVKAEPEKWKQDEDVLDTWFSSALWPFSTLGWPKKKIELERFYPNNVLITGHDILFFWVARMIMMGEYAMKKPPFPEVYLTSLIYGKSYWRESENGGITYISQDERIEYELGKPVPKDVHFRWEKMSKTKGNIIDPIEIIEEYGTDATRMALCASATQTWEIDLDRRRFEEFKNFANKIWNGTRFIFMNLEEDPTLTIEELGKGLDESLLALEDYWIISTLNKTIKEVENKLTSYTFDQAALSAYEFFWDKFCSYYLEIVKPVLFKKQGTPEMRLNKQKLLLIILNQAIRLLHPMAPFITEEIFQLLKEKFGEAMSQAGADAYTIECLDALHADACIVAPYPRILRKNSIDHEVESEFNLVTSIVYAIRNIRGEMKIPPGTPSDVIIVGNENDTSFQKLEKNQHIITSLVRIKSLAFTNEENKHSFAATGIFENLKIMIPLPEDLKKQEIIRLIKESEKLKENVEKLKQQLSNTSFIERAPNELIEKQKSLLKQTENQLIEVTQKLNNLEK